MARRHRGKRYSLQAKVADFSAVKISYDAPTSAIDIESGIALEVEFLKR